MTGHFGSWFGLRFQWSENHAKSSKNFACKTRKSLNLSWWPYYSGSRVFVVPISLLGKSSSQSTGHEHTRDPNSCLMTTGMDMLCNLHSNWVQIECSSPFCCRNQMQNHVLFSRKKRKRLLSREVFVLLSWIPNDARKMTTLDFDGEWDCFAKSFAEDHWFLIETPVLRSRTSAFILI